MNKKKLWIIIALAVVVCAIAVFCIVKAIGGVDQNPQTSEPTEPPVIVNAPALTVSAMELQGKVRSEITLPSVTATDAEDGDISAAVRMKILFEDDAKYVLPATNASVGVLAAEHTTYTATKVGTYKITYFVKDKDGNETSQEIKMTVAENLDDDIGYNLAGKDNLDQWIVGKSVQNSVINEFGEMVIAGKYGQNYTGAVYQGQKLQNGDIVEFTFRANPLTEVMFYNVSFYLTPSSGRNTPIADEGTWPKFFNMRIGKNITTFAVTDNNVNYDLLPQINLNLCDGEEHTVALMVQADTEKITAKLWIDADTSTTPAQTGTISKSDVEKKYGAGSKNLQIFSSDISGWLSFGAFCTGADTSKDGMTIKSVAINQSNAVLSPELAVQDHEIMRVDQAYTLPVFTARDANDYSDVADRVQVYVKSPDGKFELLEGNTYTPAEAGRYTFRYVVEDRNGIHSYSDFTVNCSKGASDVPPTIEFASSVKDTYVTNLGKAFWIPRPNQVTDSFGDDISRHLKVYLIGREKAELVAGDKYYFRAAGINTVRYEIEDYNGNVTIKDIAVQVDGGSTGNLFYHNNLWYIGAGAALKNDSVTVSKGGTTFTFGGQKIYDEKVDILLNMDVATAGQSSDGTSIMLINIRGGKGITKVPQTRNNPNGSTDYSWPEGMSLLISNLYGITLKGNGYESSDYAVAQLPAGTVYDTFNGKDVNLSFHAVDVYEGDQFTGVRFQLWINGTKVTWGGSFADANGDVFLPARVVNVNDSLSQAGWLSFYINEADTVNGEKSVFKSVTIDGSDAVELFVSVDKKNNQHFEIGKPYKLPAVTVKAGEKDVSGNVKVFIWKDGQSKPNLSGTGYTKSTITPDVTYVNGFTVIYAYDGREIMSVRVTNKTPATVTLDKDSYSVVFGEDFTMPKYTAMIGDTDVTEHIVVKIDANGMESVCENGVYRPTTRKPFKINYYLYNQLVKTQEVEVLRNSTNIASSGTITGGGAWTYTADKVYNSEVLIKFKLSSQLEGGNWVDFALRGNSQNAGDWFSYQNGLVLRLYADPNWGTYFKVGYGGADVWFDADFGESVLKYTDVDFSTEHTVIYSVQNVYENNVFQGIRIDVMLDNVVVNFNTAEGNHIMIPASYLKNAPAEHFTGSYLFAWGNGKSITVTEAYLDHYVVEGEPEMPEEPTEPEVPTEPEAPTEPEEPKDNIASSGIMTGGAAWAYTADKVYNSKVTIKFNLSAQLQGGNWVDFALRGNSQNAGDWFSYQNGLVLRLYADPNWGTYFKVGYGGADVWFDADFGESALKYTGVDFSKEHTVSYSIQDVYDNGVFQGIRIEVKLDGATVYFTNMSNAGYQSTSDGSYIMIPASYLKNAPAEHFTESYLFAWANGKNITVKEAYFSHIEVNTEPDAPAGSADNIASSGIMTGGGAWAYTADKVYNSEVTIKFKLSAPLQGGNWVDFALRGNSQDAGDWFHYQKGLVLRLYADPTWGTYFKVGYGGDDGWFNGDFGESALKYTGVDFSKEHTITYSIRDVYKNDVFQGTRIDVKLDGAVVHFTNLNNAGYSSTSDGSYIMIPASYLKNAPAEHFTGSYLFAWANGKNITVTEAYLRKFA